LENIDTLENQKSYKDSIIAYKDKEIFSYKDIIKINQEKEVIYTGTIKGLEKEVKKQKLIKKSALGLLVISIGFLIVK